MQCFLGKAVITWQSVKNETQELEGTSLQSALTNEATDILQFASFNMLS